MAMIRPETEMKDSGVKYIGLIPRTWKIVQLKYCTDCLDGKRIPIDASLRKSGIYPYWGAGKIMDYVDDYIFDERLVLLGEDGAPFFDDFRPVSHLIDGKVWVNNHIHVLRTKDNVVDSYLVHALNSVDYHEYINGSILNKLTQSNMNRIKIPLPSYREQQAIADYLDETCSKIDEIIAEAKASVDEYKELKQSVIFEAVTKGLDKNVEMKDSGVEGMGFIPKKWSVVRFMKVNYVRARLGWKGLKAEEYVDVGYPFLAAYHIVNNHLCWESLNCITKERYDESPEIKLSIGDLVLVKDGAGIGKCARIDEMPLGEATVNSSLSVITPNKLLDYRYEYYYFMSPLFQNIIARLKNGMGVPHLTQESMKDIYLPLPSKKEQQAIADYLDNKVVELDSLITEKESLINDLEAYKKSLIYEVVTGKRRVV